MAKVIQPNPSFTKADYIKRVGAATFTAKAASGTSYKILSPSKTASVKTKNWK